MTTRPPAQPPVTPQRRIHAELTGTADVTIILYDEQGRFRWQPPFRGDPLTPAELHRILVRVRTDWPVIMAEVEALLRRA